jgi:type I restriction enzyme S subunit
MLGISNELQADIEDIIRTELDLSQYRAFFFGSRVTGTARDTSDLDIGIEGNEPLPLEQMALLNDKFDSLNTLLKIDLVDFSLASDDFKDVALAKTIPIN